MQASLRPAVFNSSSQKGLLFDLLWGFFSSVAKTAASLEGNKTQGHIKLVSLLKKKRSWNVPGIKKKDVRR